MEEEKLVPQKKKRLIILISVAISLTLLVCIRSLPSFGSIVGNLKFVLFYRFTLTWKLS